MNLADLLAAADARVLWSAPEFDRAEVSQVVASDQMSDVLMTEFDHPLLLT